ncbi:MAG: hypothetical protein EZS28_018992 [Streblomastix strix]|uniref:Uncharacterized protein n=1 Tax=Streblomastix strix TaxID=222440 RepID=A0A5J4VSE4_9EUKA|nr:MAG: hypothetical protein EZS28_018992 [Streblomastix strix]
MTATLETGFYQMPAKRSYNEAFVYIPPACDDPVILKDMGFKNAYRGNIYGNINQNQSNLQNSNGGIGQGNFLKAFPQKRVRVGPDDSDPPETHSYTQNEQQLRGSMKKSKVRKTTIPENILERLSFRLRETIEGAPPNERAFTLADLEAICSHAFEAAEEKLTRQYDEYYQNKLNEQYQSIIDKQHETPDESQIDDPMSYIS